MHITQSTTDKFTKSWALPSSRKVNLSVVDCVMGEKGSEDKTRGKIEGEKGSEDKTEGHEQEKGTKGSEDKTEGKKGKKGKRGSEDKTEEQNKKPKKQIDVLISKALRVKQKYYTNDIFVQENGGCWRGTTSQTYMSMMLV